MSIKININKDNSENIKYNSSYPIRIKRAYLSDYPNFSAPSHWHNEMEFIYVFSGTLNFTVNGVCVNVKNGEGFFVNSLQDPFGYTPKHTDSYFVSLSTNPFALDW